MPKVLRPGQFYKDRPEGTTMLTVSLDREARDILTELSPHKKALGHVISRLLHAERARVEERQRIRQLLTAEEAKGEQPT